jgi:hypothetical protein
MKSKNILMFLGLFLITLAVTETLIETSWKDITLIGYLKDLWYNLVSLFFALLVAIPITVLTQKKYETNGK